MTAHKLGYTELAKLINREGDCPLGGPPNCHGCNELRKRFTVKLADWHALEARARELVNSRIEELRNEARLHGVYFEDATYAPTTKPPHTGP